MRILAIASLIAALTASSIALQAQPAAAAWTDGWFNFGGRASTMTRTFLDRSPARTPVVLFLQKKAGPQKCRARVVVTSGGYRFTSRWVEKYTRSSARAYGTILRWPNRAKATTVTVITNGRCVFRIYVK